MISEELKAIIEKLKEQHDVSGYDRQQNGKTVHVNPYKRGGRHDDD